MAGITTSTSTNASTSTGINTTLEQTKVKRAGPTPLKRAGTSTGGTVG